MNIFRAAKKHNIRLSRMSLSTTDSEISLNSQSQIAVTIFIMFIVFFLCWTPYFAYMVYMTARQVKAPEAFAQRLGVASYWCAFLNSCIDPFVYGVRNPLIRKELYSMCCRKFQNGVGSRHNFIQKAQNNSDNSESYLKLPHPYTNCDKSPSAYPAFINFVCLSEEDIISPYEGISKQTTDRATQTGHFQLLSIQDLCNVYFTADQPCGRNETLGPRGFTMSPLLCEEIKSDNAMEITCSSCSSACSEKNLMTSSRTFSSPELSSQESVGPEVQNDRETDEMFCCSDSLEGSLDSDGCNSINKCTCENGHSWNSDGDSYSVSSMSSQINELYSSHSKNAKRVSFIATKERAKKFKIGWMESQL